MKQELLDRWVGALEGGKHKKGKGALCDFEGEKCCLGVLADIEGKLSNERDCAGYRYFLNDPYYTAYLPHDQFGLSHELQAKLAVINDQSETFANVIEYIKKNVEVTP